MKTVLNSIPLDEIVSDVIMPFLPPLIDLGLVAVSENPICMCGTELASAKLEVNRVGLGLAPCARGLGVCQFQGRQSEHGVEVVEKGVGGQVPLVRVKGEGTNRLIPSLGRAGELCDMRVFVEDVVERGENQDCEDGDNSVPTAPPPGHDIFKLDDANG